MLPVVLQAFSGVRNVPDFLVQLEQFGLLDAILPFILIFAVIFTVTNRTNVLGEKKNVHMLVALVISLLVVIPHVMGTYPPGQDVVNIINSALPNVSLVIVIIVAALILMGIFLPTGSGVPMSGLLAFLSVGVIIYIFGISASWWQSAGPLGFLSNPDIQALVVIVLVFAVVIFLITAESPMDKIGGFIKGLTGGH
ncbi:hypothetical protein HYU40_03390 [Candidatus Woesearchaeota archaeon]|nr:hypothetical protein [Candidatus Woesearchaeota archaeon]